MIGFDLDWGLWCRVGLGYPGRIGYLGDIGDIFVVQLTMTVLRRVGIESDGATPILQLMRWVDRLIRDIEIGRDFDLGFP